MGAGATALTSKLGRSDGGKKVDAGENPDDKKRSSFAGDDDEDRVETIGGRSTDAEDDLEEEEGEEEEEEGSQATEVWQPEPEGSTPSQTSATNMDILDRTMPLPHTENLDATTKMPYKPSPRGYKPSPRGNMQADITQQPRRGRRTSLLQAEWEIPLEKPDPYKDCVQHQLYFRKDPFRLLTNAWAEGGLKGEGRDEEEEMMREARALAEGRDPLDRASADDSDEEEMSDEEKKKREEQIAEIKRKKKREGCRNLSDEGAAQ